MEWEYISKTYVFWDPIDNKKYWELELAGRLDSTVTLTVWIYIEWELIDERVITTSASRSWTLATRTLWAKTLWWDKSAEELIPFTERIDLYDWGKDFTFVLSYKGIGSVEISNANIQWLPDLAFGNYS